MAEYFDAETVYDLVKRHDDQIAGLAVENPGPEIVAAAEAAAALAADAALSAATTKGEIEVLVGGLPTTVDNAIGDKFDERFEAEVSPAIVGQVGTALQGRETALSAPPAPYAGRIARSDGSWPFPYSPRGLYEAKDNGLGGYIWQISGGNDYHRIDDLQDEADAVARMVRGQKLKYMSHGFERTAAVTLPAAWDGVLDLGRSKHNIRANVRAFQYAAQLSPRHYLAADYQIGSDTIQLGPTADLSGLRPGMPIRMLADTINPKNRNSGDTSNQYRLAEWLLVKEVNDVDKTITFTTPAKYVYGLFAAVGGVLQVPGSPIVDYQGNTVALDVANRPIVETYTVQQRAWVCWFVDPTPLRVEGGIIEYEDGHDGVWGQTAFAIQGACQLEFTGIEGLKGYGSFLGLAGTYRPRVDGGLIGDLPRDTGYGVSLGGSYGAIIRGTRFRRLRHGVTTNSITSQLGSSQLVCFQGGLVQNALITECLGEDNEASFDCHMDARDVTFEKTISKGDRSYAYGCRGEVTLRNVKADGARRGVFSYTEYESGDGYPASAGRGDGPLIDGKSWAYSDTLIDGADLRCTSYALNIGVANVEVRGKVDMFCDEYLAIRNVGGRLDFKKGSDTKIIVSGRRAYSGGESYQAVLNVDVASSAYGTNWNPYLRVEDGATLTVDASRASRPAGLGLFHLVTNVCSANIDGVMSASLSADVDAVRKGAGVIRRGGQSDFAWSGGATGISVSGLNRLAFTRLGDGRVFGGYGLKAFADDAAFGINCSGAALRSARVTVTLSDFISGTTLNADFDIATPSGSSSERAKLVIPTTSTLFAGVDNTDLSASAGVDGYFTLSFRDDVIWINNRLGRAVDVGITVVGA